jgi:hypothetical protein
MDSLFAKQSVLRVKLAAKIEALKAKQAKLKAKISSKLNPLKFTFGKATPDIIIAHCEVNDRQGVGILLKRLFPDTENIFSLRSRDLYDGHQDFGFANACLSYPDPSPDAVRAKLLKSLGTSKARRILSVPYYTDDVLSSIALKDLLQIPLCTYIMDDQNIYAPNIPDHLIRELLEKSDLRLGISPELCQAYEAKYGLKFWFLPALVNPELIQTNPSFPLATPQANPGALPAGVIIGNIWSQQWLDRLRHLTYTTGIKVHWYGNPNRDWLNFSEADLERDGITFQGFRPEEELIAILRQSPYALVLTGSSEDRQDRPELAKLSLPSRITYLAAVANLPLVLMGSGETAAARFIDTMGLGLVCDYTPSSFQEAVTSICSPDRQNQFRQRAAYLAPSLSAKHMDRWIWRSLERGHPINHRFQQLGTVLSGASAVITAFEINPLHGTGPLVRRVTEGTPNILSIHSMDLYDGEHYYGDLSLFINHDGRSRREAADHVLRQVGNNQIKQILCVPYRADDLITAITLAEHYQAPLGTYIMDDQNVQVKVISDDLMGEFLNRCSLRWATHPELRDAYQDKYGLTFHLLPAVVPHHLIFENPQEEDFRPRDSTAGVLIGSLWSKQWFDMLTAAATGAGLKLDWYGNTKYTYLEVEVGQHSPQGLNPCGLIPELDLVEKMKAAAFVVVPTGTLDARDDRQELSRLSLPGRIIFAMATSHTPIVIMGSPETPAARFVNRFGVGVCCDYNAKSLKAAVDYVTAPGMQRQMRQRAATLGPKFSDHGVADWLWASIHRGEVTNRRFEELFSAYVSSFQP